MFVFFGDWLISFNMSSGFINVIVCDRISFLSKANISLHVYDIFWSFIHQWTFGSLPLVAIVNSAAMLSILLDIYPN